MVAFIQGTANSYKRSLYEWNTDSCASRHMASNRDAFDFVNPLQSTVLITVGNGEKVMAAGIGSVTLDLIKSHSFYGKSGYHHQVSVQHTFKDVYFVPGLMANLISVTQLAENHITTVLLGRRKSDISSTLKGAAIDADTQETLFMMTATNQRIYSLDIAWLPLEKGTIPFLFVCQRWLVCPSGLVCPLGCVPNVRLCARNGCVPCGLMCRTFGCVPCGLVS